MNLLGWLMAVGGGALAIYTGQRPRGSHSDDDLLFRGLLSIVIAGVGVVLILLSRANQVAERTARTLAARHPDKPWLWRDDWEQGFARPESASESKTPLAVGALLLLISAPLALQLRMEVMERGNYPALLGLAFPVVGLLLVVKSAVFRLRQRKFGEPRLMLPGIPVSLGRRFSGRIEGVKNLPAGVQVSLILSSVRSYVSGSGSDRGRWQRVLWQDKRAAAPVIEGPVTASIPVEFEIPYDAPPTDSRSPDDEVLWRLTASVNLPGLDFRCGFVAPVFQTEAADPQITIAALETKSQAQHAGVKPADSRISSGPAASGEARFYLGAARHKGIATALTVFGLLSMGSGLFFGYGLGQAFSWLLGLVPAVIFGGVGLLLLAIAFGLWFGATTVELVNRELHVRSTYLVFSRTQIFRREEIQSFELYSGMQQGDNVWYDLRARLKNGRRRNICGGMEKSEAEWFLTEIKKGMGI